MSVVPFTGITILPEAPETLLEKAKAWGLERVLVVGMTANGEFIMGGSHSEIAESVLLLELAKRDFLDAAG